MAALFDGPVEVCVGIVPGDPKRVGQTATLSAIKFDGMKTAAKIDQSFVGQALDTNVWRINAASTAYGIQEIPTDAAVYVDLDLASGRLFSSRRLEGHRRLEHTRSGWARFGQQAPRPAPNGRPP